MHSTRVTFAEWMIATTILLLIYAFTWFGRKGRVCENSCAGLSEIESESNFHHTQSMQNTNSKFWKHLLIIYKTTIFYCVDCFAFLKFTHAPILIHFTPMETQKQRGSHCLPQYENFNESRLQSPTKGLWRIYIYYSLLKWNSLSPFCYKIDVNFYLRVLAYHCLTWKLD